MLTVVYDGGQRCIGHIIARGRDGFEAFDHDERSLGVFPSTKFAANAVSSEAVRARSLRRRIARKAGAVWGEIEEATESVLARHSSAVDELRNSWSTAESEIAEHQQAVADAVAKCREAIAEHEQAIETGLDRWRQDAEPVWREIARDLEAAAPDPDEIVWPQLKDAIEDEALFDSKRRYVQQMRHYKVHQGK
jgi:hypothetical protein